LLLYYITDRSQFPGDEASRRRQLLENITEAARSGIDYVQLREKDLSTHDLETLAREVVAILHELRTGNRKLKTGFLINSRTDVALACGADGVHLRSDDITPAEARRIWTQSGAVTRGTFGVSCHTQTEVAEEAAQGADYVVFGPVFEKELLAPAGLVALREACKENIPVFALGGVTMANAESCIQAGAAGVAGIRLFQTSNLREVVAALRRPAAQ